MVMYDPQMNGSGLIGDVNKIINFLSHPEIIWQWVIGASFWITTILSVTCLIYFAVSSDHRGLQKMWLVIVVYLLIKAVDISL